MGDASDIEHTLLAQLVAAKLPLMRPGGDELARITNQLNSLVREFDVMRTATKHKLADHDGYEDRIRLCLTRLEEIAASATLERGKMVAEAEAARDDLYNAVVELLRDSARDHLAEVTALRAERDDLLQEVGSRLDTYSGRFAPVQEGLDGIKWFKKGWKWIVGGAITLVATAGALAAAFLKIKEALGK